MNRRDLLIIGLVLTGLIAWLLPVVPIGIDPHHDGILLKPALDVLAGQTLFRDTFSQYGALTTYLQALALWINPSLLSLRVAALAAYAIIVIFLYASWRTILPQSLAALACGLFVLFMPIYEYDWRNEYWMLWSWSSVFALMFQSVGLYSLLRMIQGPQADRWAFLAGLASACVFWCRLPVGVMVAASLGATWLGLQLAQWEPASSSKRRILAWLAGGFGAVHVVMLGHILLSGAWMAWWFQNIVWPFRWSGTVPMTWDKLVTMFLHPQAAVWLAVFLVAIALPFLARRRGHPLPAWLVVVYLAIVAGGVAWQHQHLLPIAALRTGGWTVLLPAAVLAQVVISLALVVCRRQPRTTEFWLVSALAMGCATSLLQYYPLPDAWHVIWALGPAFGLALYLCWRWLGWPAWVCAVAISVVLLPALHAKRLAAVHALGQPRVTITTPAALRGMKVSAEMAGNLRQIADAIDAVQKYAPDIPSVLVGTDALYLCFTHNLTNATPYYVSWPGLTTDQMEQARWEYIGRVRPMVFFRGANWDNVNKFYRGTRYVPLIYVPGDAFEIAVPQEVADAMGVEVYGLAPAAPAKPEPTKP